MQTLDILERLVGFDTTVSRPNLQMIDFVEDFLVARGFQVHRIEDGSDEKAGLFCSYGPGGPGVMLSAHSDVVPVNAQDWSRAPFRLTREGGRLYGRGTTDMKGYLAAMLSAADRATRQRLREPLKLSISYDEEIGCAGIQKMIGQLDSTIGAPRACFVGAPTSMQVVTGHKGKAAFRADCFGTRGHSSLAPNFVNALHLATDFVDELRALQADFAEIGARDTNYIVPYSTIHVGRMIGGESLNIVPDHAQVHFEYRHLPEDRIVKLRSRTELAAKAVSARYACDTPDVGIEIDQTNAYPGLSVCEDSRIVQFAKSIARTNDVLKVPFGTEAGVFNEHGVPTVVCGPGSMSGQGHKADEFIGEDELVACDRMMNRLLSQMAV